MRMSASQLLSSQHPYQFSSMERATQAWAETRIGGVTLSRSGMSLMISALQCKYSTKMQTYENKNGTIVWSQLCQKYFHVHTYSMGELFFNLLETPAGDSLNKEMSVLWGYLLTKRFQTASMSHLLDCSQVERKGNNYFPLVRSDTSKTSKEELLGIRTKYVHVKKKMENLIWQNAKTYNLGHKTPLPLIWCFYHPSHHPTLVNVVQWGAKMIQPDFNVVFSGGGGTICNW